VTPPRPQRGLACPRPVSRRALPGCLPWSAWRLGCDAAPVRPPYVGADTQTTCNDDELPIDQGPSHRTNVLGYLPLDLMRNTALRRV
jgi:hypothetical protein